MHNPNNKECKATCDSECNQSHTHFDENDCTCPTEQKEEWEEELYNLAAINYNLYLSGTCERADTGEDWTFDDARWEIRDFIRTQIALAEERGRIEGYANRRDARYEDGKKDTITAFVEQMEIMKRLESDYDDEDKRARRDVRPYNEALTDILAFADSLKSNLTQKS